MNSVLFVDDEPSILDGLRRVLHPMRRDWDMRFVTSGEDALQVLSEGRIDVLVSDMRMPVMDGAELFRQVQERFPSTIRIILSGQSHASAARRTIDVSHQFLTKPCDPVALRDALGKTALLDARFGADNRVRDMVAIMTVLPVVGANGDGLRECVDANNPTIDKLTRIADVDIAMTAKLLQLSNAALFGSEGSVFTAREAMTQLGPEAIPTVAKLLDASDERYGEKPELARRLREVTEYSVKVARVAERLMPDTAGGAAAYTAGLLHRIGTVVLAARAAAALDDVTVGCAVTGTSNGEIGAGLLSLWGLPESIVDAVGRHNDNAVLTETSHGLTTAVYIAAKIVRSSRSDHPSAALDPEWIQSLGLTDRLAAAIKAL